MRLRNCLLSLAFIACGSDDPTEKKEDTDTGHASAHDGLDSGTEDDTGGGDWDTGGGDLGSDTGEVLPEGPCGDGTWGGITDPENTIHIALAPVDIREESWEMEPGSPSTPLTDSADLAELLDSVDGTSTMLSVTAVAYWPGDHTVEPGVLARATMAGLRVEACTAEETKLDLAPLEDHEGALIALGDPSDALLPISPSLSGLTLSTDTAFPIISVTNTVDGRLSDLQLTGSNLASLLEISDSTSLQIDTVTLVGGNHALSVSDSDVVMNNVIIEDSTVAGIWTTGPTTGIQMNQVVVKNTSTGPGMVTGVGGWGMFLEGERIIVRNATVDGAKGIGIMAEADVFQLYHSNISNVEANGAGFFGRGLHINDPDCTSPAEVLIENVNVSNTDDAGVFLQAVESTTISGLTVNEIATADIPLLMGGGTAGDGILLTGRSADTASTFSSSPTMSVVISETFGVHNPGRDSLLVDYATVRIESDTTLDGSLSDASDVTTFTQNGGAISGDIVSTDLGDGSSSPYPGTSSTHCINLYTPTIGEDDPVITASLNCSPH